MIIYIQLESKRMITYLSCVCPSNELLIIMWDQYQFVFQFIDLYPIPMNIIEKFIILILLDFDLQFCYD